MDIQADNSSLEVPKRRDLGPYDRSGVSHSFLRMEGVHSTVAARLSEFQVSGGGSAQTCGPPVPALLSTPFPG